MNIITEFELPVAGPYSFNELAPLLANYYNCQIHLIHGVEQSQVTIFSEPNIYDDSKHLVFIDHSV